MPPASHAGMALSAFVTAESGMTQSSAAGMAMRTPCMQMATTCQSSMPLKSPFSAQASMAWTMPVASVRQIIVRNRPATDSGMARATEVVMALLTSALPPLRARTMMMAEATDASAASGATAAPMFAQPRAIIWSWPPRRMPSWRWPLTRPMSVQATRGWWNSNSSRMPSIPARKATMTMRAIVIGVMCQTLLTDLPGRPSLPWPS